jgi:hypothetical protein
MHRSIMMDSPLTASKFSTFPAFKRTLSDPSTAIYRFRLVRTDTLSKKSAASASMRLRTYRRSMHVSRICMHRTDRQEHTPRLERRRSIQPRLLLARVLSSSCLSNYGMTITLELQRQPLYKDPALERTSNKNGAKNCDLAFTSSGCPRRSPRLVAGYYS